MDINSFTNKEQVFEDSIELKEKLGIESAKDLKQKLTKICDNTNYECTRNI